jgi:hypothetical protein
MGAQSRVTVLTEAGMRRVKEIRAILVRAGIETFILRPPAARNT